MGLHDEQIVQLPDGMGIPAHGPDACENSCQAKDKKYRPQDYHNCRNLYFYFPQILIKMKMYDWICTSNPDGSFDRAECIITDPYFLPKPIGAPNTPTETHPYAIAIRISLIQKKLVPTKTTDDFIESIFDVHGLKVTRSEDSYSAYPLSNIVIGTGSSDGNNNQVILDKDGSQPNWGINISDGWDNVKTDNKVGVSDPDFADAVVRKNSVLLHAPFIPTHMRIEFKSNCTGCGSAMAAAGKDPICTNLVKIICELC